MKTDASVISDYIAGALGGIGGLVVGHPLDTVKVHLQVHMSGKGTLHALKEISRHGKLRGLFRGLSFPMATQAATNSVFFGVYGSTLVALGTSTAEHLDSPTAPTYGQVFVGGCAGGLVQIVVTCPVELVKTFLQSQLNMEPDKKSTKPAETLSRRHHVTAGHHVTGSRVVGGGERFFGGPVEATRWIYRRHGPLGFYRGLVAMTLRDPVTYGVYLVSYEYAYRSLVRNSYTDPGGVLANLLAGGLAGVVAWTTCMPFDVIKSHLQSDAGRRKYAGTADCAVQLFRRWGARGFFAGLPVVCIRAFPTNAITFLVYSKTLTYLKRTDSI